MRGKHKIQVPNKRCRVSGFLFMLPAPLSLCSVENQFFCLFGRLEVQFFFWPFTLRNQRNIPTCVKFSLERMSGLDCLKVLCKRTVNCVQKLVGHDVEISEYGDE